MNKIVNVAIIGCGRVAGNHLNAINEISDLRLVAACDLIQRRADELVAQQKIPTYSNYFEMLEKHPEIDLVAVITPSGMHYEHAMDIIQNFKKNVLIEKPIVLRLLHGKSLKDIALRNGVKVFPIFQYRFNKSVQRVKKAILNDELGNIFLATVRLRWCRTQNYYNRDPWRGTFAFDGGACTNQGIHHIDLLRYLVGEVRSVNANMSTFGAEVEVEDTVTALLEFENGCMGVLEITTATRPIDYESSISIIGSKGIAIIGGSSTGKLVLFSPDPKEEKKNSEDFPNPYGFGHRDIYTGIYDCLVKSSAPAVEFEDAMKSIQLLHSLYVSAEKRNWITVKSTQEFLKLGQPDEVLAQIYRSPKPSWLVR